MLAAALPALPKACPALEAIPLTRLLQERLERFLAWSWPRPHVLATAEPTRWTVPLALFDWLRTIPAMRVQMLCVRLAALFWVLPQFPEIAEPTELVVDNVAFARSRTMPVIRDHQVPVLLLAERWWLPQLFEIADPTTETLALAWLALLAMAFFAIVQMLPAWMPRPPCGCKNEPTMAREPLPAIGGAVLLNPMRTPVTRLMVAAVPGAIDSAIGLMNAPTI